MTHIAAPTVKTEPAGTTATAKVDWTDAAGKAVTELKEDTTYTATITVSATKGEITAKDTATVTMGDLTQVTDASAKLTANQYRINADGTITIIREYEVKAAPKPVDLSTATVTLKEISAPYTGSDITPEITSVTLEDGDKTITLTTDDYAVSYEKGTATPPDVAEGTVEADGTIKNAGAYKVKITTKDPTKYTGTATADFTITKATRELKIVGVTTSQDGKVLVNKDDKTFTVAGKIDDNAENDTPQYTYASKTEATATMLNIRTGCVIVKTPEISQGILCVKKIEFQKLCCYMELFVV